jgi:DNA-binding Xre family transcriptional regulator
LVFYSSEKDDAQGKSSKQKTVLSIQIEMIYVKLREAMDAYRERTGARLTYETIAAQTGISVATLQSLAARTGYNTTLSTIEKLCRALQSSPADLLEMKDTDDETSACRE